MKADDDVWFLNGDTPCLGKAVYMNAEYVTIYFHDAPITVPIGDVFETKAECYRQAGLIMLKEAGRLANQAFEWLAEGMKKQ